MRVLLVEDDQMVGAAVVLALQDAAYAVDWVRDGVTAEENIRFGGYQVILLDLGLPEREGLAVLQGLRRSGNTISVIILTARDGVQDRIDGLDAGADDYLVKPFAVSELLARIRAVVRRQGGQAASILSNGVVSLNLATHEATCGDTAIFLSAREFALLHSLLLHPGQIFSRAELEEHIYGEDEAVESNAVDFLIHGIRKKIGMQTIKIVRGAGWMVDGNT